MAIDASLVARAVGVEAVHKDAREGSFSRLPQRVFMIASGEDGASYTTTKFQATSAGHVGQIAGYRSQAYLMARQLLPASGVGGLGTIPLTVCLVADANGAAAATGDITPSGTATRAESYRVNVSEVLSTPFVIPAGAISVTNVCRSMHDAINGTLGMPVVATYTYGTVVAAWTRVGGTPSNGTVASFTTTGKPAAGVWTLTCTAEAANAGTFTVTDPYGVLVGTVSTMGAHTVAGLGFTLADGSEDFNVGDIAEITVPATKVDLKAGWKGTTGNDIDVRIDGPSVSAGVEFVYTQPTGGLVDPNPVPALEQIGQVWETMVLNGCNITNTVALDAYHEFGEARRAPTVKKPVLVFTGADVTTPASAIAIPDARKTDRTNHQLVAPGSRNLPCVIAARQLAQIARMANNTPSHDYCLLPATGLVPGADGIQWDLLSRDIAVKGGSSTVEIVDNVVRISNVVSFYHPSGEEQPAYRFARDQVCLQNIVYAVDQIFATEEWAGAALVPDDQPVTEPTAKKPKMAKGEVAALLDNLGLAAIISDPATSKKGIQCWIDSENPKRLNLRIPVKISGTTNIIDAVIEWSFFFGSAPLAA